MFTLLDSLSIVSTSRTYINKQGPSLYASLSNSLTLYVAGNSFRLVVVMAQRSHEGPMDFEYQNGTGPMDARSPFAQLSMNQQRATGTAATGRKRSMTVVNINTVHSLTRSTKVFLVPSTRPPSPPLSPPSRQLISRLLVNSISTRRAPAAKHHSLLIVWHSIATLHQTMPTR